MPTTTEVCNYSLDMINSSPINDLDATDAKSQKCKRIFFIALQIVGTKDDWAEAEKRVSLAALSTAPISEWTYQYQVPADCLKPQRINNNDAIPWELNEDKILTNEVAPIILEYLALATNPNLWRGGFMETFTAYLASRYAKAFPQDNDKAAREFAEYQNGLNEGRAQNGQTGPVLRPAVNELLGGRRF